MSEEQIITFSILSIGLVLYRLFGANFRKRLVYATAITINIALLLTCFLSPAVEQISKMVGNKNELVKIEFSKYYSNLSSTNRSKITYETIEETIMHHKYVFASMEVYELEPISKIIALAIAEQEKIDNKTGVFIPPKNAAQLKSLAFKVEQLQIMDETTNTSVEDKEKLEKEIFDFLTRSSIYWNNSLVVNQFLAHSILSRKWTPDIITEIRENLNQKGLLNSVLPASTISYAKKLYSLKEQEVDSYDKSIVFRVCNNSTTPLLGVTFSSFGRRGSKSKNFLVGQKEFLIANQLVDRPIPDDATQGSFDHGDEIHYPRGRWTENSEAASVFQSDIKIAPRNCTDIYWTGRINFYDSYTAFNTQPVWL